MRGKGVYVFATLGGDPQNRGGRAPLDFDEPARLGSQGSKGTGKGRVIWAQKRPNSWGTWRLFRVQGFHLPPCGNCGICLKSSLQTPLPTGRRIVRIVAIGLEVRMAGAENPASSGPRAV